MMDMKRNESFSKTDSLALKGIAILLLLFLHCFGRAWRFEGYEIITYPFQMNHFIAINEYFRICVSIFAFISGYGLYLSAKAKEKEEDSVSRWIVDRWFKTLKGYWFIYLVSIIVLFFGVRGYIQEEYFKEDIATGCFYMFLDFLGVSKIFGTPSLNGSWWYMGAITTYIIMMPFIVKWVKKYGFVSLIGLVIIIPRMLIKHKFLGASSIYSFMLPLIIGALFAEKDLFRKFDQIVITKKKWMDDIIIFAVLLLCMILNIYIWVTVPYKELWEYHFALIPISAILFYYKFVIRIPVLRTVLLFLGKHSMNIFLFHTFVRNDLMHDFIYGLKVPVFIVLTLLAVSLMVSLLIELLKKWLQYDKFIDSIKGKIMKVME